MKRVFMGFALFAFALMVMPVMAAAADYGGPYDGDIIALYDTADQTLQTLAVLTLTGEPVTVHIRCTGDAVRTAGLNFDADAPRSVFEVGWRITSIS